MEQGSSQSDTDEIIGDLGVASLSLDIQVAQTKTFLEQVTMSLSVVSTSREQAKSWKLTFPLSPGW